MERVVDERRAARSLRADAPAPSRQRRRGRAGAGASPLTDVAELSAAALPMRLAGGPGATGRIRRSTAQPAARETVVPRIRRAGDPAIRRWAAERPEAAPRIRRAGAGGAAGDRVIRRAPVDHFSKYLRTQHPGADDQLKLHGWLLDQNVFELETLLSGDAAATLHFEHQLASLGSSADQVVGYLRGHGAPGPEAAPIERVAFLHSFIAQAATDLTTKVSGAKTASGGAASSVLSWDGLTPWGAGTGATLTMLPGGLPSGSTPNSDPTWIKTIEGHVARGGGTSIYVRGHLLNHNIGGPGLDYNMVPLTGKPSRNAGGNDANAEHLRGIETAAKGVWDDVARGRVPTATYAVRAVHGRTPRPATKVVREQANVIRTLVNQHLGLSVKAAMATPRGTLDSELATATAGVGLSTAGMSDQDAAHMVAGIRSRTFVQQTLKQLDVSEPAAALQVRQLLDLDVARASLNGLDPEAAPLADLLAGLEFNATAWEAEEHYVPVQLDAKLDVPSDPTRNIQVTIPITLPTDPKLVGYREKTKSEWA